MRKWQFSKTSLKWVRSMIHLILFILGLATAIIGYDLFIIRSTILDSISSMTDYLQHSVDSRFDEIVKYLSIIELHQTNIKTKKKTEEIQNITNEQYKFSGLISTFKLTNKLIDGILVYYPDSGIIIGDQGCFKAKSYYAIENNMKALRYDSWINKIKECENGIVQLPADESMQFCYVKAMRDKEKVVGYIVIRFQIEELLKSTEGIVSQNPSKMVFGIVFENEVLSSTGNRKILGEILDDQLKDEKPYQKISDNNYLLYIRQSQINGIQYLNAYNLSESLKPLKLALLICVLGLIFTGCIGLLFSLIISKKNAEPLMSIIQRLGDEHQENYNEYQIINKRIDSLFTEKNLRTNQLQSQQDLIGGLFLNMVINTVINNERDIFSAAKRYDISFENPYYLIGIIKLDFLEKDSLRPLIVNFFQNMNIDVTVSYLNQKYLLLFNIDEGISVEEISQFLRELLSEEFWNQKHNAYLGSPYDSLVCISKSYQEAMSVIHQNPSLHPGDVLFYQDDGTIENDEYYKGYKSFIQAVSDKRYLEAKKAFEIFYAQSNTSEHSSFDMNHVSNSITALLKESAAVEGVDLFKVSQDFFCYSNPKKLKRNILEVLDIMASIYAIQSPSEKGSIAEKAKIIINRDYTDSLLGLYRISEELHVSNSYLSTTFKSTYGIGVSQYINQLRIDLAKDLILSTNMNIKDIAVAVGFSSDISFIRVFKKYESKTPNKLRTDRKKV